MRAVLDLHIRWMVGADVDIQFGIGHEVHNLHWEDYVGPVPQVGAVVELPEGVKPLVDAPAGSTWTAYAVRWIPGSGTSDSGWDVTIFVRPDKKEV